LRADHPANGLLLAHDRPRRLGSWAGGDTLRGGGDVHQPKFRIPPLVARLSSTGRDDGAGAGWCPVQPFFLYLLRRRVGRILEGMASNRPWAVRGAVHRFPLAVVLEERGPVDDVSDVLGAGGVRRGHRYRALVAAARGRTGRTAAGRQSWPRG